MAGLTPLDMLILACVALAVGLAVRSMLRTRKTGGCTCCPHAGSCGADARACNEHGSPGQRGQR